ncbi:MAG TPA: hypothetical protein VGZ02_13275 [Candidatus Baltobacteraceae bacterium]|jgi:type IV secretory pathway VirB2 component (pilin)|nr:hypothetical protein [Candidatus Baltobacteraceae bacterium]
MLTIVMVIAAVLAVIFIPPGETVYARFARAAAILLLISLGLQWFMPSSVFDTATLTWIQLALLVLLALLTIAGAFSGGGSEQ